jgi:tetratricopeptide (TPR) repeat protein
LLDRAAEIGLLTPNGDGYYSIHPAVPWFFKKFFDYHYPGPSDPQSTKINPKLSAARAFVEAMTYTGAFYHILCNRGQEGAIYALMSEEPNLVRAKEIAQINEWYDSLIGSVQGLYILYERTGRRPEMRRLVAEILPNFVAPDSDGPIPGREEVWSVVTGYRVSQARYERMWAEAERLQRLRTDFNRQRASSVLELEEVTDETEIRLFQNLAISLEQMGQILREQKKPECVTAYEEANSIFQRIRLRSFEANVAFNIGGAYLDVPNLYDTARAEEWFLRSLELTDEKDRKGRGQCLLQLGKVKYSRFQEAQMGGQPEVLSLRCLEDSRDYLMQALSVLHPHDLSDRADTHNQLGMVFRNAGETDLAFKHYQKSIRYSEAAGDVYAAARSRRNFAFGLAKAGRFPDAKEYAYTALRNFETYGERAAEDIQKTRELIELIEQQMKAEGG